jgi:uncharacterized protein (DUF1501 family)
MKRRDFLAYTALTGVALASGSALHGCGMPKFSVPRYSGKRLVVVKLDGGNDGLFSFFPEGYDEIGRHRPGLYKEAANAAIKISHEWRLNRHLQHLMPFWEQDEIAVLPYVGYPNPNTSHFKSAEIWETGYLPGASKSKEGWLGRLMDDGKLQVDGNESPVLSLAERETLIDKGRYRSGRSWIDNTAYGWFNHEFSHWLGHYKSHPMSKELEQQFHLYQWLADIAPASGFPQSPFGDQLAKVASMILAEKPFKVFYTTQTGYDTHLGQPERLSKLYFDLSLSLGTFAQTMKAAKCWAETLVFVYSEFGRTIDENKNLGTDHGAAGLCLLIGQAPLLAKYKRIEPKVDVVYMAGEPYLNHQVDFRDIYTDIEEGWLMS